MPVLLGSVVCRSWFRDTDAPVFFARFMAFCEALSQGRARVSHGKQNARHKNFCSFVAEQKVYDSLVGYLTSRVMLERKYNTKKVVPVTIDRLTSRQHDIIRYAWTPSYHYPDNISRLDSKVLSKLGVRAMELLELREAGVLEADHRRFTPCGAAFAAKLCS